MKLSGAVKLCCKAQCQPQLALASCYQRKGGVWCMKLCSTVFTHSSSCFNRYVWFNIHSVNSGNVRAVKMLLTSEDLNGWLSRHSAMQYRPKSSLFSTLSDEAIKAMEAMDTTSYDSHHVYRENYATWSDFMCHCLYIDFVCNLAAFIAFITFDLDTPLHHYLTRHDMGNL